MHRFRAFSLNDSLKLCFDFSDFTAETWNQSKGRYAFLVSPIVGIVGAMLSVFPPRVAFATASAVHITIHFQRPGEDYAGWNLRTKNVTTVNYNKGLIALRKTHLVFRMQSDALVRKDLAFLKEPNNVIAYSLNGNGLKDSWHTVLVAHNPNATSSSIILPAKGDWKVVVQGSSAGPKTLATLKGVQSVKIQGQSTLVLEK